MKIRVEHFQYFVKIKRTVGKRTKNMFFPENEITLKTSCSWGGGPRRVPSLVLVVEVVVVVLVVVVLVVEVVVVVVVAV